MVVVSLDPFDAVGTTVFVLLAVASSVLLGRVVEASHRREFVLELQLRRDARTDALTGLDNRRAMEERGPIEIKRAQRSGAPVSIILCDLDHFKSINDRYGHEGGDTVLRTVAMELRAALRETDVLGRWGGEEFMAVLVDTDSQLARFVAERMRSAIAKTTFAGLPEGITISVGVATQQAVVTAEGAWDHLVKEADQLLYQAKKEGRNRIMYSQA
jgi:diguanylate cyclase (GGDEF)-like protein